MDVDKEGGDFTTICTEIERTQTNMLLATEPGICHRHRWVQEQLN